MDVKTVVDKAEGLFSLPEVCRRLGRLLDDNDSADIELAELISCDPVFSAKLLGLANAPPFTGPPVESISAAISRVGTDRLRGLLVSTNAINVFASVESEIVDMENFWHHSVCCALACESLAREAGLPAPQQLFVAGLMHDIGQLPMYQVIPDLARKVLQDAAEQESYRYRMEKEVIGFTHAAVGRELLHRWGLPPMIQKVVEFHHEPGLAGDFVMEASIAHIATAVASCVEPSWKSGNADLSPVRQINPFAWRTTGLSPDIVDPTISEISIESMNVMSAVDPDSSIIF